MTILDEIKELKRQNHALILAHFYQPGVIQDLADVVGDSLELARRGKDSDVSLVVLCGVHFMAESAAILSPNKTVILPAFDAGCPMADTITVDQIRALRQAHPGAPVVCYVNTSAAVKAECDVCCTSSNAARVVAALPEKRIIFVPDRNLGAWVADQLPDKEIILHPGLCPVHHGTTTADVEAARRDWPGALLLAHPECPPAVLAQADFIGSTAQIIRFVSVCKPGDRLIIGTEEGILHPLRRDFPDREYRMLSPVLRCRNMKKITPESLRDALRDLQPRIIVPPAIAARARASLDRMLELS